MLTATSNQLYSCPAHGTDHDLFLSYQAQTDAATVQALKEVLTSVALRRYGKPLSVFHDVDCLNNPSDPPASSISALPTSKAVFLLLSKASMDMMKDKTKNGQEDNVVLEIKTALDLKDAKRSLPVLPLGIATKETKDGVDDFTPFLPYMVSLPDDPAFAPLKQILGRVNQIQSFGFRPDQMHKRVYRLLNLVHPIPPNMDLITAIHRKYFCDSKFRFDPAHLDTLLKQLTLTGRAVISGMGGMGKSVLAVQILFFMMGIMNASNKEDLLAIKAETIGIKPQYRQVFWINCSTESTALDGLIDMFPGIKPDVIKEHASRFLANTHGYLLVLDNVDDINVVDSVFEHSKSVGFGGDVVMTTRLASLPPGAFVSALETKAPSFQHDLLRLGNWDDKTTLDYIMSSSPMIVQRLVSDEARKSLDSIVARISGYPLVIQTFMTFAENYDTPLLVLEATFAGALELQDGDDDTRSSLKVIVDLSLDSLMRRGDEGIEAARLFGALSLVAPTNIQFELIKAIAQKMELKTEVTDLIKMMVQSGLLRSGAEGQYSTHSLTQQVAREYVQAHNELDAEGIEDATGEVLLELAESMDIKAQSFAEHLDQYAEYTVPEVYTKQLHGRVEFQAARLAQHRPLLKKAMEKFNQALDKTVNFYGSRAHENVIPILNGLGNVALQQADLTTASKYLFEDLDATIKLRGTREHIDIARTINSVGMLKSQQGHLEDALELHREALQTMIKVYGSREHPDISATLNNIGAVEGDLGNVEEALQYYEESLQVLVKVFGKREIPEAAQTITNLGMLACHQGRLSDALELYHEALQIMVKAFGTREHPDVAAVLTSIGGVKRELGHFDAALKYYEDSLDISVKLFGTREHPDVAQILNNIGHLASDQGRLSDALELHHEALQIMVKTFATRDHPAVASTLSAIGSLEYELSHFDTALKHYEESLAIYTKAYHSRDHFLIAGVLRSLGLLASARGQLGDAHNYYQEALEIMVKVYGMRQHPEIAAVLNDLGLLEYDQGRLDEALVYFQESIDIMTQVYGTRDHIDIVGTINNIGLIAKDQRHYDQALEMYQEALSIQFKILGTREHPDIAQTLEHISSIARFQGRLDDALQLAKEMLDIRLSVFGTREHIEVASAFNDMGAITAQQKHNDEALQHFQNALEIYIKLYGTSEHPDVAGAINNIGLVMKAKGQKADALKHYNEAFTIYMKVYGRDDHPAVVRVLKNIQKIEAMAV